MNKKLVAYSIIILVASQLKSQNFKIDLSNEKINNTVRLKLLSLQYVGASYKLNIMQEQLQNFKGSDRKKAILEKQITNQTNLVSDLKGQYSTQIGELGQKQARQVELKKEETPERKN